MRVVGAVAEDCYKGHHFQKSVEVQVQDLALQVGEVVTQQVYTHHTNHHHLLEVCSLEPTQDLHTFPPVMMMNYHRPVMENSPSQNAPVLMRNLVNALPHAPPPPCWRACDGQIRLASSSMAFHGCDSPPGDYVVFSVTASVTSHAAKSCEFRLHPNTPQLVERIVTLEEVAGGKSLVAATVAVVVAVGAHGAPSPLEVVEDVVTCTMVAVEAGVCALLVEVEAGICLLQVEVEVEAGICPLQVEVGICQQQVEAAPRDDILHGVEDMDFGRTRCGWGLALAVVAMVAVMVVAVAV